MLLQRADFLTPKLKIEKVALQDLEGGEIFVKQLTAKESVAYVTSMQKLMEAAKKAGKENPDCLRESLIVLTACDESGNLIFEKEDVEALGINAARVVVELYEVASKLNPMGGKDAEEEEVKNSKAPSNEQSSD